MRRVMGIGLGLFLASVLLLPVSCGLGGGRSSKQWIPPPPPVSVGKAFLGPLVGATVEIYEVEANGVFTLQFTETTSDATELRDAGSFPSHATELTRTSLYLFKVTGGVDVDADYDTVRDPVPTPNQGSIHALVTGEQVKAGTFWVTALTEVAYRGVRYMMLAGYPPEQIGEAFDEFAPLLIAEDATGDGVVDREDLHQWASYDDLDRLRKDVTYYEDLVDAIRANDEDEIQRYAPHLADASVAFLDELDPRHLVVEGTYAYVAEDELGLAIVDVSDPAFPEVVSILDTPGDAEGVAVLGTLAYIADDTGLQIVDITDPTNPVLRGRTTEDFDVARAVTASGTHAFVAARANGLFIMDVTDPDAPYVVWERHEDEWLDQVFLQGDLLYVAAGWGIFILDVTNPSDPVYVGDYEVEGDADVVIVEGGLAYVGASDEQGLLILDVSNPGDPQYVASVESPGDVEGLALGGGLAFLGQRQAGLQIVDVSDPTDPQSMGTCSAHGSVRGLAAVGDHVFSSCGGGGVRVFDVSDLGDEVFADTRTIHVYSHLDGFEAEDVVTDGRYAYIVANDDGVTVVDLIDPTNPVVVDQADLPADNGDVGLSAVIQGNYLYVTLGYPGLQIVDITDPTNVVLRGQYDDERPAQEKTEDVAVQGDYAYLADRYDYGVLVVDVSDPDHPFQTGRTAPWQHSCREIAVRGNYAFTAFGFMGLRVIDVNDPYEPFDVLNVTVPLGSTDLDWCHGLRMRDTVAYLFGGSRMYVFDVSAPTSPGLWSVLEIDDYSDIAFGSDYAYVATGTAGIEVIGDSDPLAPYTLARVSTQNVARGVALMDEYVLVADSQGLTILLQPLTETLP